MQERKCRACGQTIPLERLELLPNTTTCIKHSTVARSMGFMVPNASKGTALELQFIPQNPEAQRIARRAHRRSR